MHRARALNQAPSAAKCTTCTHHHRTAPQSSRAMAPVRQAPTPLHRTDPPAAPWCAQRIMATSVPEGSPLASGKLNSACNPILETARFPLSVPSRRRGGAVCDGVRYFLTHVVVGWLGMQHSIDVSTPRESLLPLNQPTTPRRVSIHASIHPWNPLVAPTPRISPTCSAMVPDSRLLREPSF